MTTNAELGREAYEAYAESVDHRSVHGDVLWAWDELPERIKNAWICSALVVKSRVTIDERQSYCQPIAQNWPERTQHEGESER